MTDTDQAPGRNAGRSSLIAALALAAASVLFMPTLGSHGRPPEQFDNPSLLEARSLLRGEFALERRAHDTALYQGKPLNVFQPGQTLFFLAQIAVAGDRALAAFRVEIFAVFAATAFLFGLALIRLSDGQIGFSVALAVSAIFGAPYLASLPVALTGSVYRVNHAISILLVAGFLLVAGIEGPRRRPLLTGLCLGGAMLFRAQYALLLLLPFALLLQDPGGNGWRISGIVATPASRREIAGPAVKLLVFPALAMIVILGFQAARFGNPFETGYAFIYAGRDDYLAKRAIEHGIFSMHFLPENLLRTLFAFPAVELDGWRVAAIKGDGRGNSLLFSQPILLLLLPLWRSIGKARAQAFLLASLLLALPVWLHHNPGVFAPGYLRLSLDYLVVWIATIAVFARYAPRSRAVVVGAAILAAWSVVYALLYFGIGVST